MTRNKTVLSKGDRRLDPYEVYPLSMRDREVRFCGRARIHEGGKAMKQISPDVFRAYDIRGIVDVDFDPEWVELLGKACGTYFRRHGHAAAVLGYDCRHSSHEYCQRFAAGLMATGVDVLCVGMAPTPVFYYAVKTLGRSAGAIITASHNPPEYNGFKVWAGETTLHTDQIQDIYRIMAAADFESGVGLYCEHDIVPAYLDELVGQVKLESPVTVVVDGGNGAGGLICAELLRRAGATVIPLFCDPDGDFPNHHPDPVVEENVRALQAKVLECGADVGLGLDGDADRLGVVDERGRLMYGDQLLAIYSRELLQRKPGATIIAEAKCSHLLYRDIAAHGGAPIMAATGHSFMKAKVKETGAALAGEMSGHMFFADRYYGFDDGIYAALRLVEILGKTPRRRMSELLADWPPTFNTPEIRMDCPDQVKFKLVARAQEFFRAKYEIIDIDGVRIVFPDGWGLLRASNTQPVLVLRFEAESEQRLAEIRALIEEPLRQWLEEMS